MKKFTSYLLVCFTLLCLIPTKVKATHCAGAELLFEWVSDSTYRIYYKFYRDCTGTTESPDIPVCYYNNCDGFSSSVDLQKVQGTLPNGYANGSDIASVCPGQVSSCTNPQSYTVPGYQEWWYTGTVTLPSRCNYWTFAYGYSARNNAITNLQNPGSQELYVEAHLDNLDAQGDTSPFFSVRPVPYVCANEPYTYNNGAVDVNNDSLYFQNQQPLTGECGQGGAPPSGIPYVNPSGSDTEHYDVNYNPLESNWTFTLDHNTGQMSFTPDQTQRAAISLLVQEFRSGQLIGSVMRDIQIVVLTCPNQQPSVNISTNTLTGAIIDNNGYINACAGTPFSFCYDATSGASDVTLVASDNHSSVTPSATVSYSNQASDTVKGCYSWTPGPTDTGLKIFTVTVKDSTCGLSPIIIAQTFVLPIYITPATTILDDTAICPGASAPLLAVGGTGFVWDVLPGGSPISSLSCTSCNNPTATPTVTTQYTVTATGSNNQCKNKDTVTVTVVPSISVNAGPDLTGCVHDSVQLNATISAPPGSSYLVRWTGPTAILSNDSIANPIVGPLINPTYTYIVTVTSTTGICPSTDTVNVAVLQGFTLFNHDTAICNGASVQVDAAGSPAYQYAWAPTAGVAGPGQLAPVITPSGAGIYTYTVTASYPGCRDSSASFNINVQQTPTVVAGGDRIVCSGDTVHLNPIITPANATYTYVWTPGNNLDNPNAANAVFNGLTSTSLTLEVQTSAGCSAQDDINITVVYVKFLHVSSDTVICPRDSAQIRVTGDSLASFVWSPDYNISDSTSIAPYVWPATPTVYYVYGKDSTGCNDTAMVSITVRPGAIIDMPDSVLIYPGDTYHIQPSTNCSVFAWSPALGLSDVNVSDPVASPPVSTRYKVEASTEAGCKTVDSIDVDISNDSYIAVPNAFTPGNGPNNLFKVLHLGEATLDKFQVYNRWGIKVFETEDINTGWNGEYNGEPQPSGVYIYLVEAHTYKGVKVSKQGNVTLLR